jgi:GAF domain-containing protein
MVPADNAQSTQPEISPDQLVYLSRFLKALRSCQTPSEAMTLALDHIHQTLNFDIAWLGLYDRLHHRLLTRGCHSPKHLRSIRTIIPLTPGDVLEQVVIQQRPLIIADLQNEIRAGEWGAIAKLLSLQSAIVFPIKRQDVCFGLTVLASSHWGVTPSLGERAHLSIVLGELAELLHHAEADQQRQQEKRFERPFMALLSKLGNGHGFETELLEVVRETQRFIAPHRTRIFWFEPQGNYFWQRLPAVTPRPRAPGTDRPGDSSPERHIPVDDIRGLYQVLCKEQLVVVGESRGALKAVVSERLLQHLPCQALMVAPIVSAGELLGFMAVEGNSPRIWKDPEKQFFMAAARLLGLAAPVANAQAALHQVQLDQHLTTGVIQGIYGDVDWHLTLADCAQALQERLSIQQFLVLLFNPSHNGYDLCFQHQVGRPRSLPLRWPGLDDVDWQMLERSQTAIAIDNIHQNLKLTAWRPQLMELGVQSVLASNVCPGKVPEGIVIITDQISRHWTLQEQHLFEALSQQIGVILHQWQLQRQLDQQQHMYDSMQWGLHALHRRFHSDQLEQTTVQHILQLLQASTVLLISWEPGAATATVTRLASQDNAVWVNEAYPIPVGTDAMLNWAMQTDGILPLTVNELPPETADWFSAPTPSRILLAALRTAPEHVVTGTIVVVASAHHAWAEHHLSILKLLTNQLAWSRRHLRLVSILYQQRQDLEHLNWYKHHCLEDCYRGLQKIIKGLTTLSQEEKLLTPSLQQQLLASLQMLGQAGDTVLGQEAWRLQNHYQTMPLITLINHLMERLDPLLQSRQLWSKVHNQSSLMLGGDMAKLEMIIYDVMAAACDRSPLGGRIDIWCRSVNPDWFELSITDDGQIASDLLEELNQDQPPDLLAPSLLDVPPGLHLAIGQSLMRQLGGNMTIAVLDDGRTHSRLLLPRATPTDAPSSSSPPTFDAVPPEVDRIRPI